MLAGLAVLWWRWRAASGDQPASGPLRDFVQHITVFVLACTVPGEIDAAVVLGALATLLAMINVAGGFLVTQRMLQMFRKG